LVIASTIVLSNATLLPTLYVVFVATLATWLVTAQTDNVVPTHEIPFQEVPLNVALVEAMQSTENTRTLCQSSPAILLAMARLVALRLVQVCTIKAINMLVLVEVPNLGNVNQQALLHHGNDKTVVAITMAAKIKAALQHHGLRLLVDMVPPLVLVLLLGNKLHPLEVTTTAIKATLLLATIRALAAMVLHLLRQGSATSCNNTGKLHHHQEMLHLLHQSPMAHRHLHQAEQKRRLRLRESILHPHHQLEAKVSRNARSASVLQRAFSS